MREVYATARIGVELVSTENLNLPTLNDVDVGRWVRGGNRRPSKTSSFTNPPPDLINAGVTTIINRDQQPGQ